MDDNIRNPDSSYRETLLGNDNNFNEEEDEDMRQIMNESLKSYNNEYLNHCQDELMEKQIQEILQKEHDEQKVMRQYRESILQPIITRLIHIDPDKTYLNVVKNYINTGNPIEKSNYDNLLKMIQKPLLIELIKDNISYAK